jgi:hypothetical protein
MSRGLRCVQHMVRPASLSWQESLGRVQQFMLLPV